MTVIVVGCHTATEHLRPEVLGAHLGAEITENFFSIVYGRMSGELEEVVDGRDAA